MRVLHVTDCYRPRLGGIEIHVADLVAHQRASGVDARVITITPEGGTPDSEWVYRAGRRPGRPASYPSRSAVAADAELRDLISRWRPDQVHVHVSVFSPFATLAARRATREGLPTLLTVHSMWNGLGPLPAAARLVLQLRRWPMQWSAVSDAAARPLRAMLGPAVDVAVLPNAVDPALWHPDRSGRSHGGAVSPTLISVMRFTRTKRALPLARMLDELRSVVPAEVDFRAIVIGDGPEHAAFSRFAARHRMSDWLELPGRLDRAAVRGHLARADCFVAPAQLESFGIAALEARALGLPVVAPAQSGISDFITDGRDGLLTYDDRDMVAALARVITDRPMREAMRDHNERTPISHDWSAALKRTQDLYARAASVDVASHVPQAVVRRVAAG